MTGQNTSSAVMHGDCVEVMRNLARDGFLVDAVVTDPPYHFASIVSRLGSADAAPIQSGQTGAYVRASTGFQGQEWDGGDIAFRADTWRRVFDVMKPGAHLIAFAATKGYHRMACAIEDAGFEIRDMVPWLYGTGFPKSHNLDGEWEGWGTALKPAIEPVVLAQKPISETSIEANVLRWGVGAINIDACRIQFVDDADEAESKNKNRHSDFGSGPRKNSVFNYDGRERGVNGNYDAPGRFPANLCHDGSAEVMEAFAQFGDRKSCNSPSKAKPSGNILGGGRTQGAIYPGQTGSAARFFYSSKASQGERIFECKVCGAHTIGKPKCGHEKEWEADRTKLRTHPTVKPISLMRWYVEMVTPPGGLVLDPFAGTGTTAAAAREAGFSSLSIEASADHVRDIGVRLGISVEDLLSAKVEARACEHGPQADMFL